VRRLVFIGLSLLPAAGVVALSGAAGAGDGKQRADGGAAIDGGAKKDSGPVSTIPPDPTPLEEKRQWVIDLRWQKGEVFFVGAQPVDLEVTRATPRVMGRFAIELFSGKTLIERVRFDFPGLVDGDFADAGHSAPPRLDRKLTTRIGVMFPRTSRGTRLELWDRATDRRWSLPWPDPSKP